MTAFVTVDQYCALTRLTPDFTNEIAIQMALDVACQLIRSYLGQTVDPIDDETITLDGTGRRGLILPEMPVRLVNTVVIDLGLDTEVDVTDFDNGFGGVLYRTGAQDPPAWWDWDWWGPGPIRPRRAWPLGIANITVNYDHGFTTVPSDLVMVAIQVARAIVNVGTPGLTGETIGGYAYTRDAHVDLLGSFTRVLDVYKLPRVMVA